METERTIEFKKALSELLHKHNAELWAGNGMPIFVYLGKDKSTSEVLPFEFAKICGNNCGFGYYWELIKSGVYEEPMPYDQQLYDDHIGKDGMPR